jgi:hypothetical protein
MEVDAPDAAPAPAEEEEADDADADAAPAVDRNAAYKAALLADARRATKRSHVGIEGEAEESDEEDGGQMGLGDFGFGVSSKKPKKGDDPDEKEDLEVTAEDLEAIVDELSDGEGDEAGAEAHRLQQDRKTEREEMAAMLQRVRDGFGSEAAGGGNRGAFRLADLVGMDKAAKAEAKRLGLGESDDEVEKLRRGSDGEESDDDDDDGGDEERGLAALISQELKNRHLGARLKAAKRDEIQVSDSESDDDDDAAPDIGGDGSDDDESEAAIARRAKTFARRAKMRRALAEKAHRDREDRAASGDAKCEMAALLEADEDSQLILSMLQRSQSSSAPSAPPLSRQGSLLRQPSLARTASSASDGGRAAKKPRLGAGVDADARDTLLDRCGSFFATLNRAGSRSHAPTAKAHASRAGRGAAASISSLFGGDNSNSQFGFANSRSNLPSASSSNQPQGDKIVGGGAPKQPIWAAISKA